MRVLVTGAAGFIGHWVCRLALDRGWEVTAWAHRSTERLKDLKCHAHFVLHQGDLCDREQVERLVGTRAIEAICHLAVVPPGAAAETAQAVNIDATRALASSVEKMGLKRLLYTSSMSVYNFIEPRYIPVDEEHPTQPLQAYGREKLAGEEAVLALAEQAVVLRLAGIYGPDRHSGAVYNFIRAISERRPLEIAEDRAVDMLYVEDAAAAVLDALQEQGVSGVYNVGFGQSLRLSALAVEIGQLLGAEPNLLRGSGGSEFYMDTAKARAAWSFAPRSHRLALRSYIDWIAASEEGTKYGG